MSNAPAHPSSRPRRAAVALGAACAALLLAGTALLPADAVAGPRGGPGAGPRGGHWHGPAPGHWRGGYYRGPGWGWGGVTLGIGLGALAFSRPYGYYVDPLVVERPVVYVDPPMSAAQPVPAAPVPAVPDPVVYPSRGQTPQQTEADRQDCNRWATSQPNAIADASVFQRATAACLEGRGYTVR